MNPSFHPDTIVALATGAGRAAIGVIRISGPATTGLLARFCRVRGAGNAPDFASRPRRAIYCDLTTPDGETFDSGLVTFFPGPASYTGEDLAEIALHGNPLLLRRCVEILITAGLGARPADPGEFTRRAFLNGKLDLSQAEAVRRIIEAKSQFELRASQKLLAGELSRLVSRFRSTIISLKAETEAEVDFATEDLTFETRAERISRIVALESEIAKIVERAAGTTRAASGFQIALMGVPNAGKSSLLNRMLGWDRAIVSDIPGTTRDYLAEEIELDGVSVRFVDTAGLRATTGQVEAEGVRRSEAEIKRSQLVLHVIDGARPAYSLPPMPQTESDPAVLYVLNKRDALVSDAWSPGPDLDSVLISCVTGDGLESLREKIRGHLFARVNLTDPLLLEERHRFHFLECRSALGRARQLLAENAPAEIVALEIDAALRHTGEVTGRITDEEILGRIFSMFCVGK